MRFKFLYLPKCVHLKKKKERNVYSVNPIGVLKVLKETNSREMGPLMQGRRLGMQPRAPCLEETWGRKIETEQAHLEEPNGPFPEKQVGFVMEHRS